MVLFDRAAELVLSNGYTYSIENGARFRFDYSTTGEESLPTFTITLLNLSRGLREQITEGTEATFNIGYGSQLGELVSGVIKNIEMDTKTITFDIMSAHETYSQDFSQWYDRYVREDYIVEDIASNLGFTLTGSEYLEEYRQVSGYTVTGQGINSIIKICNNRGLSVTTRGNIVEIYKTDSSGIASSILFKYDSGLIDVNKYVDQKKKYDYILKALPISGLAQGDIVKVEHYKLNGICKIIDYEIKGSTNWEAKYFVKVIG